MLFRSQSATELASLTYGGSFGIGITNPTNTLHVVGTSTVTSNSFIGGNIEALGSLTFGSGANRNFINPVTNSVLNKVNLNVTSGVSTVATILVSGGSSIGIGTTSAVVGLDARLSTALFNQIGLGTNNTTFMNSVGLFNNGNAAITGQVAIGGTQVDTTNGSYLLVKSGDVRVEGPANIIVTGYGAIGINSQFPIGAIDLRYANLTASLRAPFYPPVLTTAQRNNITPTYVAAGAIIYNSDVGKHQGYTGIGWSDFY